MSQIKILVTEKLDPSALILLQENPLFHVDINLDNKKSDLLSIINKYNCLLIRSQTIIDKDIIQNANNLLLIGRAGVGLDNIDILEAQRKNIKVINSPKGNSIATAELTMGLILCSMRKIPKANEHLKQGLWQRSNFMGQELHEKTLGLIGFGNVGQHVCKIAKSFGMNILAYDPFFKESVKFEYLLKNSDIISLHCILNNETKNIINKNTIGLMKPQVILINTARGDLIDSDALIDALDKKQVAFAALDVFKKEPPDKSDPLLNHEQILVTPHLGASTIEAQRRVSIELVQEVLKFFNN